MRRHARSHFSWYPGGNPGANRWFLQSTPTQMPPESGEICGSLTEDLPLGYLQGGVASALAPVASCLATKRPMWADARTVSRFPRTSPTCSPTAYIGHTCTRAQHPVERWRQPCSAVPQLLKETSSPNAPPLRSRTREARSARPNAATQRGKRRSPARRDQGRRTAPPAAARRQLPHSSRRLKGGRAHGGRVTSR